MELKFIPKSGVAFIFISIFIFMFWAREYEEMSFLYVVLLELALFFVCLLAADLESKGK